MNSFSINIDFFITFSLSTCSNIYFSQKGFFIINLLIQVLLVLLDEEGKVGGQRTPVEIS